MRAEVGRRSRVIGVFLALGLVFSGLAAPAAAAPVDGIAETAAGDGNTTTVTVPRERWWHGQGIPLDIAVTRAGEPATGDVRIYVDGKWRFGFPDVVAGRAAVTLYTRSLPVGEHTIQVRHVDLDSWNSETEDWDWYSEGSVVVRVDAPAVPVLTGASWYYGDRATLRFDLTGTDEPRDGTVELTSSDGELRSAQLVDGVAALKLDGTEVYTGSNGVVLRHRTAGGDEQSVWWLDAEVASKPVSMIIGGPRTWRHGEGITLPVDVASPLGTPTGPVRAYDATSGSYREIAQATIVDGRATLRFPATAIPTGTRTVSVQYGGGYEFETVEESLAVTVLPRRTTSVSVTSPDNWTYGTSRRVTVNVTSSGATPTGRVELYWAGTKVGSGTLSGGKASVHVGATKVDAGKRSLTARYVGSGTFAASSRMWSQRVREAQPTARLTLARVRIPVDSDLTRRITARVRVATPGVPETGRLCLLVRDPSASNRWEGCQVPGSPRLRLTDGGSKEIKVSLGALRRGYPMEGKVYVKIRFFHTDPNVRVASSSPVTVTWY